MPLEPRPFVGTLQIVFDPQRIISDWVVESGLTKERDKDIDFYVAAYRDGRLNFRDIRKRGAPLTKEEKAVLGIRYRGVLTREFVETLNEDGLRDPEISAQLIAQPASHRLSSSQDLRRKTEVGIELVRFQFGHMLAGHCSYSKQMDDKRVPIAQAQPLPSPACEHPDQCGCRWQAWLPIMDELGVE